jgi:hypothetical protein
MVVNFLAGLILAINGQAYDCAGKTFDYLNIAGSDITVTNCVIRESGVGTNAVSVHGDRNTLRHLTVERSGAAGVYFYSGTGHVLEDSMIRDPQRREGWDSWGIYSASPGAITIRRTTVHGSGFSTSAAEGSSLIEYNRFIVPEDYRTNCKGEKLRDGPCQCAEFAVALKPTHNVIIRGNVFSGYRQADPVCGGSGSPGIAIAVDACGPEERPCPVDNVVIESNVITNSHVGIYLGPGATNVRIEGNHICDSDYAISDGFGKPSTIVNNVFIRNVEDLHLYGSRMGPVSGNTVRRHKFSCTD